MTQLRLEEDDVVAAQVLHTEPAAGWAYFDKSLDAVMIGLALLSLAFGEPIEAAACLGVVVFGKGVSLMRRRLARWNGQRFYRREQTLRDPSDLQWNERGLTYRSSGTGGTTTTWGQYRKWKENERVYLLYPSRQAFQIVPKRLFGAPAEEQDFRRHLSQIGAAQAA